MNIKRKLLSVVFGFFFLLSVWAQRPTKDFPYEYYNSSECSLANYRFINYEKPKPKRDDENWTVTLYVRKDADYIVFEYKEKAPAERDIKNMLEKNKSVWKNYDAENGSADLCLIFLDSSGSLICSAKYSENY